VLETANVAGMQQIKAAVGEDDAAAIAFPGAKPQNRLLQCEDGIQRVSVRALPEQIVKPEVVVYHAGVLRRAAQGAPVVGQFPITRLIGSCGAADSVQKLGRSAQLYRSLEVD